MEVFYLILTIKDFPNYECNANFQFAITTFLISPEEGSKWSKSKKEKNKEYVEASFII